MATNRQYLIPGWGYINETSPIRQFLIPGQGYLNSTATTSGGQPTYGFSGSGGIQGTGQIGVAVS